MTVISDKVWRDIGQLALTTPVRSLMGPDAMPIHSQGKFSGRLFLHNREATEEIYVVPELTRALLGRTAIERLHLIRRLASVQKTQDPKEQFPSLFQGLEKLEQPYTIQLQEDARPFALSTPCRVAIPLLQPVQQELEHMEKIGVISRVNQPTEWCAGMVVVPKASGKVRIYVDLTKHNKSVQSYLLSSRH